MRLIDADAILHTHKIEQEAIGKDWCVDDLATAIMVAETVDAIPVEWLRSQLKNNPNDIESAYDDICINELIDMWQREQEA